MYKIVIDRSLCSGYGSCIDLAPGLFELDDTGTATVRVGESTDPAVIDAASACPMAAISIIEQKAA